jgi:hypothetical protein
VAYPPKRFEVDPVTAEIDEEARRARGENRYITRLQARQLAWLKRWSRTENRERLRGYFIECQDCGIVDCQHVATEAARVVIAHAGHSTWVRMLPGSQLGREWW